MILLNNKGVGILNIASSIYLEYALFLLPCNVLINGKTHSCTMAYVFAASLMVMAVCVLGFFLSFERGYYTIRDVLVYLTLTGFPTLTWLGYLRGHCAIFVYLFLMLLCLRRIFGIGEPDQMDVSGAFRCGSGDGGNGNRHGIWAGSGRSRI